MTLTFQPVDPARRADYEALFRLCFPGADHLDAAYLQWLYAANPDGTVVGFDAWDGATLVAHYVCIPARAVIGGESCRVLLSLNTATAPAWQGQGLFTRLAALTYERATAEGFRAVYGVANANSTPGFLRKLGFTLVRPLEARLGLGRLFEDDGGMKGGFDLGSLDFRREWSAAALAWRQANPLAAVSTRTCHGRAAFFARTRWPLLTACAELPAPAVADGGPAPTPFRVFLGTVPEGLRLRRTWWRIPAFLKPSPLNLIYRDLQQPGFAPAAGRSLVSFLDFDAF